jgi:hypothetical protein
MLVSESTNIPPAFDKGAANCTIPENGDPSLVMTPGMLEVSMMTSCGGNSDRGVAAHPWRVGAAWRLAGLGNCSRV